MIPPSYLFKSVYQHEWVDQPAPVATQRPKFYRGLLTPLLQGLLDALRLRDRHTHDRHYLTPAHD
jgi:hypothetical protein